ncbi:hypothetical protein I553_7861 [Mycobacterium xenopi 4042]|uniref:Uncharacterized protein n=1 Tax=Mycobacterium xenopi 4042 TaxID=1299334 RepID=X8ARM1_MYCXE|nr:hypothetical protein I553_7861 [Mycobacterium xenopi 4042]
MRSATAAWQAGRGSAVPAEDDPHHFQIDADETPELDEKVLTHPQRRLGR